MPCRRMGGSGGVGDATAGASRTQPQPPRRAYARKVPMTVEQMGSVLAFLIVSIPILGALIIALNRRGRDNRGDEKRESYATCCTECGEVSRLNNLSLVDYWSRCPACGRDFKVQRIDDSQERSEERPSWFMLTPQARLELIIARIGSGKMLTGACAGLADRFALSRTLVRVLFVAATIFTFFVPGLLLYLILIFFGPKSKGTRLIGRVGDATAGASRIQPQPPSRVGADLETNLDSLEKKHMIVTCPCGKRLQVGVDLIGKRVKCPACGHIAAVKRHNQTKKFEPGANALRDEVDDPGYAVVEEPKLDQSVVPIVGTQEVPPRSFTFLVLHSVYQRIVFCAVLIAGYLAAFGSCFVFGSGYIDFTPLWDCSIPLSFFAIVVAAFSWSVVTIRPQESGSFLSTRLYALMLVPVYRKEIEIVAVSYSHELKVGWGCFPTVLALVLPLAIVYWQGNEVGTVTWALGVVASLIISVPLVGGIWVVIERLLLRSETHYVALRCSDGQEFLVYRGRRKKRVRELAQRIHCASAGRLDTGRIAR